MTDTVEKVARALRALEQESWEGMSQLDRQHYLNESRAALYALTPGTRWTLPDGRQMVAVPVEPSEAMKAASYRIPHARDEKIYAAMIAAASEPGASAQTGEV